MYHVMVLNVTIYCVVTSALLSQPNGLGKLASFRCCYTIVSSLMITLSNDTNGSLLFLFIHCVILV